MANSDLTVRELEAGEEARWDAFVARCPEATFFHRAGWKRVLEQGLGHRAPFLLAERDGEVAGVLPLGHIRSWLFGRSLTSTPFCVYGGAAADSEGARSALEDAARRMAETRKVDALELRHREARHPDWPAKRDHYATFRREIEPDPDANYNRIRRKQRAEIRKGIANGLYAEVDSDPERFYPVFAESVRNLGTPVFPKGYFQTLKAVFGEDCEMLTILHEGRPVSAVMSFYFRDEVLPYHGGGIAEARDLRAGDFMYWELMRRSAERGIRIFDFGRSKVDTGAYHFKRHWGFEPEPLHYEYHLVRASEVPDLSPANPKYQAFIGAWKRLPVGVSRLVGPWLARSLG
ncbi:FemAB family XrtA/PEP-CTERM system-associated protein [Thiohalorhabdus sp.]|uniref:FemAB family XrtA/PEP-CTERM system-associated protein n=1 Tax=Thiohalorhabdus sp. TaxID=3094134 RepID=UPI002FC36DF8